MGGALVSALDALLADSAMDPAVLAAPGLREALERALLRAKLAHGDHGPETEAVPCQESEAAGGSENLRQLEAETEQLRAKDETQAEAQAALEAEVLRLQGMLQAKERAETAARKNAEAEARAEARRRAQLEDEVLALRRRLQTDHAEASSDDDIDVDSDEAGTDAVKAATEVYKVATEVYKATTEVDKAGNEVSGKAVKDTDETVEDTDETVEDSKEGDVTTEEVGRVAAAAATAREAELLAEVAALEGALRRSTDREAAELDELAAELSRRDERIEELQEALRESVRITAHEEQRRRHIMGNVAKLEQRLLSLQTAYALRCPTCRPLLQRVRDLERHAAEWRRHLAELGHMKQEALESAISEKDAHLALLEVSGLRTAKQAEEADKLRADRRRLMDRLKQVNEESVKLSQQESVSLNKHHGSVGDVLSRTSALSLDSSDSQPDKDEDQDRDSPRFDQVSPDSAESPDASTTSSSSAG